MLTFPQTVERFWDKVEVTDSCWNWIGAHEPLGYGRFRVQGKLMLSHRFAYELLIDHITVPLELDHLCRNTRCVNPAHLDPVSHTENVRRGIAGNEYTSLTHCKYGHSFSGDNLYLHGRYRKCKKCTRRRKHEQRMRNKALRLFSIIFN